MDSFRVANPLTHDLALKAASLVLEFAAQDSLGDALDPMASKPFMAPNDSDYCFEA
jgi:hypothetical protein